jgi:small nuclear ribonucleoprotein (snRNP)-like protein
MNLILSDVEETIMVVDPLEGADGGGIKVRSRGNST